MGKPSRSDEHPPPHVEARIEAAAREYFDDLAPNRHAKPSRSDPGALLPVAVDVPSADHAPIPELAKFQDLEAHSQKIACESDGSAPAEEFMATDYYDDLNCMDKHHHTTGSGFIKVEGSNPNPNANSNTNERYYEMAPAGSDVNNNNNNNNNAWIHCHASEGKSNPATNDWIPSAQTHTDTVSLALASTKPQRSDN